MYILNSFTKTILVQNLIFTVKVEQGGEMFFITMLNMHVILTPLVMGLAYMLWNSS